MARKSNRKGFAEPKTPYAIQRRRALDAAEAGPGKRKLPPPEALPDGTTRYFLVLGPKGRVLLPAEMREAMGLDEGDVITAWLKDGEVRMHSHLQGLRKLQVEGSLRVAASVYASDELIAERRAEAAKEDKETRQELHASKKRRR